MKKYLISLLLIFAFNTASFACIDTSPDPLHYYLFCHCDGSFGEKYKNANDAFWKEYVGKADQSYFYFHISEAKEAAYDKGDTEMEKYLGYLEEYLGVVEAQRYSWDYPSEEELAQRAVTIRNINTAAAKYYSNGALADRYALLFMRTNLYMKRYAINVRFWESKKDNYADSHIKDLMKNIYANALLNLNRRDEAWDIYAQQNDEESLLWSTRNHANFEGLQMLCKETPNAPIVEYILQRYVNSLQDALDNHMDYSKDDSSDPCLEEAKIFLAYALDKAEDKTVQNKCQWMTAAALVNHCLGNNDEALSQIEKALKMKGEKSLVECAERIKLAITTSMLSLEDKKACRNFVSDWKALSASMASEKNSYLLNRKQVARMRVFAILMSKYREAQKDCESIFMSMCFNGYSYFGSDVQGNGHFYESGSMGAFDALDADKLIAFFNGFEQIVSDDPILASFAGNRKFSDDYIKDHIGTRLIIENRLSEALPYLEKVSIDFLKQQNIGLYASQRTLAKDVWFGKQPCKEYDVETPYNINRNVKVDFCKRVLNLQKRLATPNDAETIAKAAYELGSLYCQASYYGECWYVSQYFVSPSFGGEYQLEEGDFMDISRKYLKQAKDVTNDPLLKIKACSGLAYTAPDSWISYSYDYDLRKLVVDEIYTGSEKYIALRDLSSYCAQYPTQVPKEISKCDVLRTFEKTVKTN